MPIRTVNGNIRMLKYKDRWIKRLRSKKLDMEIGSIDFMTATSLNKAQTAIVQIIYNFVHA